MTSNTVDEQHIRGWRKLKHMPQGASARCGHGCCEIDEHRMIILGGLGVTNNVLSSGFIYDAKAKQSTPLPNRMPTARYGFSVVSNEDYMYIIGGRDDEWQAVNTVYRLSLETYEWTTMAQMGTARAGCVGVLLGYYIYIFGGTCGAEGTRGAEGLVSVERYSIVGNTWENLPDMAVARCYHCAVAALRNVIYILGGNRTRVVEVFDTALLEWRTEARLCDMPKSRNIAAAVVLKNRYLVMIGGYKEVVNSAGCLIYDCLINQWSSTPASINMIIARISHTAAVLDGKIIVAGGSGGVSSMECIDIQDVLEYAPLDYPLPQIYFDQILLLGKALLVSKHT